MKITEITNGIHYVGVNDRCKYKFENIRNHRRYKQRLFQEGKIILKDG